MQKKTLTKKEEDILSVLWDSKKSLTVKEITEYSHQTGIDLNLNQSTIQATINKLINSGYVRISDIKQTSTNFARAFEPMIDREQYAALKMKSIIDSVDKNRRINFIAGLINNEDLTQNDLDELASLIEELRRK